VDTQVKGGKRAGAGRRGHGLSLRECLTIGAEYDRLLDEGAKKQARERLTGIRMAKCDAIDIDRGIRQAQDSIRKIEIDAPGGNRILLMHSEIIDSEIGNFRPAATPDRVFLRARSYPLKRVYRTRKETKATVVAWCKVHYGVTISDSKADECLKVFRRHLKRLRADVI
jgi:hypothetical protein